MFEIPVVYSKNCRNHRLVTNCVFVPWFRFERKVGPKGLVSCLGGIGNYDFMLYFCMMKEWHTP